ASLTARQRRTPSVAAHLLVETPMLQPSRQHALVVVAFLAVMPAAHGAAAQNIVANPSFEIPAFPGNGVFYSNNPAFSLPGWTVSPKLFLEYGTPFQAVRTAQGRQSLFLNSDGQQATPTNPAN